MNGHQSSDYTTKSSAAAVTDNGLPRRRFVVSAATNNSGGEVKQIQHSNDNKKLHNTTTPLQQRRRIQYKSRWTLLLTTILLLLILTHFKHTLIDDDHLSTASFLRCSSFFLRRSSSSALQQVTKQTRIILTASHIRHGSDGELRLRIIEHNLSQLISSATTNNDNDQPTIVINKSILIFSLDEQYKSEIQTMVTNWKSKLDATIIPTSILYVRNDAILVDASKWMYALTSPSTNLLSDIQSSTNNNNEDVKIMLLNDSFILTRSPTELWNINCGQVCGLAWSSTSNDPSNHIQSYIRTLTPCAIERYMNFYYETQDKVHNVHELIVLFEINLDWAKRRGRRGIGSKEEGRERDVSAIYDYVGSHPDEDDAQKILIPKGYPAIKLKKFFTTSDPWLSESPTTRTRLPPSFSTSIYKSMNHDLNHLSDVDLEKHFVENGYKEDRVYGSNTLVIKDWLLDELMKMHDSNNDQMDTIDILTDYLLALNGNIAKLGSV